MDSIFTAINREAPKWVIDRIEEEWAVLENTETLESISLPVEKLPKEIREGVTLVKVDGKWYINEADTSERQSRINNKFEQIRARAKR